MLKIIRKGAIENPWVFRIIMGSIALTFMLTMGWWGLNSSGREYAAIVNGEKISLMEYNRAYQNAYKFYRNIFKEKFDEDMIKKLNLKKNILNSLIEKRLLLRVADEMNLSISNDVLKEAIIKISSFQTNGRFDPELYDRVLALNHISKEAFEVSQREDMLIDKVRNIIKSSITLTEKEIQGIEPVAEDTDNKEQAREKRIKDLLNQKQNRGLMAYIEKIREKSEIEMGIM
ncbi:MAG: SurA N-terminal domain-containing protein [Nitrospirota bacterium]